MHLAVVRHYRYIGYLVKICANTDMYKHNIVTHLP